MRERPTSSDDVIDSRDVIEAIAEIESELDDMQASGTEPDSDERAELVDELSRLRDFAAAGESLADWQYGEALVRDSYFEDYARELADDIGAVDKDHGWPSSFIDWPAAADALKQDYTPIEFDGVTYWGRS